MSTTIPVKPLTNYYLYAGLGLTSFLPAAIGWLRFRRIESTYYPFLWITWAAFFTELVNINMAIAGYTTCLDTNLYQLLSYFLLLEQFRRWQMFKHQARTFKTVQVVAFCWWVLDNLVFSSPLQSNWSFATFYSFSIGIFAIYAATRAVAHPATKAGSNPVFVIAMGLAVYHMVFLMVEGYLRAGLNASIAFQLHVYDLFIYTNGLVNVIYFKAILWMPTNFSYILRS